MTIHTRHSDRQLEMELVLRPAELAIARRIARAQLHRWGLTAYADDVVTVVNELLTNVLDHVQDAHCALTMERKAYLLHVRVSDNCRAKPVRRDARTGRTTGRGLALVDALTHGCWKVVAPPPGQGVFKGKEIHCLFDVSQATPPASTIRGADIVREIFRYGLARPEKLAGVIRYTRATCDHLATGEPCTRHCLAVTIGLILHSSGLVRLLSGPLTRQDDSPAAAAHRITTERTGLRLAQERPTPPLWIEQRQSGPYDGSYRERVRFWYFFEAPSGSPELSPDRAAWMPIADIMPTPLRDLVPTASSRRF
ncbi:anti-sigma regulatory factor (Ser/Thr protein kinase) [Streptomyces olivoverticillatus]|uniref:Anti-sigma regulatory factor (Ser/Thr protein kinase) n=1 Tax=Streptomyces olivoverticillatus TaxID=66427 RepID=A0A7W7LS96_9ACTN|nr:ATP-binding protein [Streptomyces olivoverticillatus]MBB4895554.1 anti-sigma regulatory factor (Ser/Thr protein kinase) [Streptomyces olivoverticillatus]